MAERKDEFSVTLTALIFLFLTLLASVAPTTAGHENGGYSNKQVLTEGEGND